MEINEMMEIVLREMKENNINLEKWSRSSCGLAYRYGRKIKIPKPVDYDTLGVCFHEIGHIALGHMDGENGKTRYVEEFEAEMFAIQKLHEYGYYNKRYELRAKSHVLFKIAQAKNRGHNMKKVPKEIVDWTRLQINKWNKAKKVFVHYGRHSTEQRVQEAITLYKR